MDSFAFGAYNGRYVRAGPHWGAPAGERETAAMAMRYTIWACLLAGLLAGGCGPKFDFKNQTRANPNSISPHTDWKISARGGAFTNLPAAIDGNVLTTAVSAKAYQGASVTVDLSRPCVFNLISMMHGKNPLGFAEQVAVSTSNDGKTFTRRGVFSGTREVSNFPLLTPVTARYIRFTATKSRPGPWAMSGIYFQ